MLTGTSPRWRINEQSVLNIVYRLYQVDEYGFESCLAWFLFYSTVVQVATFDSV